MYQNTRVLSEKKLQLCHLTGLVQSSYVNIFKDLYKFGARSSKGPVAENSRRSCHIDIHIK